MEIAKQLGCWFVAAALLLNGMRSASAQPLLRPAQPENRQQQPENRQEQPEQLDAEQEPARRDAGAEEDQRLRVQEELMRLRGEQMQAEREEQLRTDRMMRYALWIAITVIAITMLVAYVRSQNDAEGGQPKL